MLGRACSALMLLALVSCSSKDPPPADSGPTDSGSADSATDSGAADSGSADSATDSGAADSATDSGSSTDSGTADSGTADAGASCDTETPCGADAYCVYDDVCGREAPGHCEPRPEVCTEDCPGVCGCDGRFYCNACLAASMGVDVDPADTCRGADCDPMDARGEGLCRAILGYRWTGSACQPLSGCSCVGADCTRLYGSLDECTAAHRECVATSCDPMDARGEGLCRAILGYRWTGSACQPLSGCSCVGADCTRLYGSLDECSAAFAACTSTACGGFLGSTCGPTQWCDYADGGAPCGFADGTGVCRPRPAFCAEVFDPVCGCDGVTYSNECSAQQSGQDIQRRGPCERPPPPPPAD